MATSSSSSSSSSDEFHVDLRDINFWLNGYQRMHEYHVLVSELWRLSMGVGWNVGVGPAASFRRAISTIALEAKSGLRFDPVIKVDLRKEEEAARGRRYMRWLMGYEPQMPMRMIEYELAAAVAEELGLLDQEYKQRKKSNEELRYYTYGMDDHTRELMHHVRDKIVPRIFKHLIDKTYLLVIDNLYEPIESLPEKVGIPPYSWKYSDWLISTASREVCDKSNSGDHTVLQFSSKHEDEILLLILSALHQSAKFIYGMICQQDERYWHRVALGCFHYAMLLLVPQHPPPQQGDIIHSDGDRQSNNNAPSITSDELIRQWAAQGILTAIKPRAQERTEEEAGSYHNKYDDIHQVGNVILQAFREYCLLQLPFSPATEADAATETAAQFLTYHGLIGERLTVNTLLNGKEYMEKLQWISFMDDQGWHIRRLRLSEKTNGPTALILRRCSQQLFLFSQLDSFLPKLCFLRVLDLSYTPLKSLPPSVGILKNLRLLSLRGCHDLKTLLINSSTTNTTNPAATNSSYSPLSTLCQLEILDMNGVPFSHLSQDMGNQKSSLIHLDMSYSQVTNFPLSFFQDMSNLEVLVLVKCPNLVELPPSMAALLSLTTLEVTGTQIKSFPEKMFEEMKKLQSLKLIDNKKMVEELKLDGHPTLKSFSLICAPHVRSLSLHGCRKLESVDLRDLGVLKDLDLSATAIKELPADIPNLPQLRRLLLMGVPSLKRFPWHKLQRLPDVFCLDHCADGNGNYSNKVAHMCINDSRLFHSFNNNAMDLVRNGRFFQSFHVQVAPCNTNFRQLPDEEGMLDSKLQELVQKKSTYMDVYNSYKAEVAVMASPMIAPLRRTERHVEISSMNRHLDGLSHLLQVTRSISMTCDTSVLNLSNLSGFNDLEECELRWCHQMRHVFHSRQGLNNLRNVKIYNLKTLVSFFWGDYAGVFSSLKHLHFEDCPRLEKIMPCGSGLSSLTTLDIMFCYNLKAIFYRSGHQHDLYHLPCLQQIRLQELPQLQYLHEDDATIVAPMWKGLHAQGCWSLRRLPCLEDQPRMVEVNGGSRWWHKLHWASHLHRNSYVPKLSPEFASFDERAVIKSYLR